MANNTLFSLGALISTIAFSGCGTVNIIKAPTTPIIPLSKTFAESHQTAKVGDLLFEQLFIAKDTARLTQGFYLEEKDRFNKVTDIRETDILYRLDDIGGMKVFCTYDDTKTWNDLFGGNHNQQTCFFDTNDDGKFDKLYTPLFEKGLRARMSNIKLVGGEIAIDPIDYIVLGQNSQVNVQAGLRLSGNTSGIIGSLFEKIRVEFVMKAGFGQYEIYSSDNFKLDKNAKYPKDINMLGARIRLYKVTKNEIVYQVLSGFPENETYYLGGFR